MAFANNVFFPQQTIKLNYRCKVVSNNQGSFKRNQNFILQRLFCYQIADTLSSKSSITDQSLSVPDYIEMLKVYEQQRASPSLEGCRRIRNHTWSVLIRKRSFRPFLGGIITTWRQWLTVGNDGREERGLCGAIPEMCTLWYFITAINRNTFSRYLPS